MSARFDRAPLLATAGAILLAPAVLFGTAAAQDSSPEQVATDLLASRQGSSLGPHGGEVRALVLAPSDPERLYLGTATGHVFVSSDRAATWTQLELSLGHEAVVDNVLVHPSDPDTVYAAYWTPAGTGGLVRSRNGGDSWQELPVAYSPSLRAIAAAPSDPDILYVGGIGGIWRSDDGGDSWMNVNGRGLAIDFIESLAIDPRDPDQVYAGTWRQVYRTDDGGRNWRRIYQGMALDRDVFSLAISPHDPDTLFAGTCNFLYRSDNRGGSWQERRSGLASDHNRIHTILHHPLEPGVVFAGTRGALYRSDDGGASWTVLRSGIAVSALALDVAASRLYVGTEEQGVLAGSPAGPFRESNAGLTTSRVAAFDTLPGSSRVLFAARADGARGASIHSSTDAGRTWRSLGAPGELGEVVAVRAQAEPVNRVLVAGTAGWFSLRPGGDWSRVAAPPGRTVAVEIGHEANGAIVAATSEGIFTATPESLVAASSDSRPFDSEPASPWSTVWSGSGLRALGVAGFRLLAVGEETVVSGSLATDAEAPSVQTWNSPELEGPIVDVALAPTGTGYLVTPRAVFRSGEDLGSWNRSPLPWPAADLRAVAVDPTDPDQVLVLDYRGAVYRGHGGGRHWLILDEDPGLHRAWNLGLTASAPGYALVGTQGHGLRVVDLRPMTTESAPPATTSRVGDSRD